MSYNWNRTDVPTNTVWHRSIGRIKVYLTFHLNYNDYGKYGRDTDSKRPYPYFCPSGYNTSKFRYLVYKTGTEQCFRAGFSFESAKHKELDRIVVLGLQLVTVGPANAGVIPPGEMGSAMAWRPLFLKMTMNKI